MVCDGILLFEKALDGRWTVTILLLFLIVLISKADRIGSYLLNGNGKEVELCM